MSRVREPISEGRLPTNEFVYNKTDDRNLMDPMEGEMEPENRFSYR
jgi:hypothetical protein